MALLENNRAVDAAAAWRRVLAMDDRHFDALHSLARLLATHSELAGTHAEEALRLAARAVELAGPEDLMVKDTLAAAMANAGQFRQASEIAGEAARRALAAGRADLAARLQRHAALYADGKPLRASGVEEP